MAVARNGSAKSRARSQRPCAVASGWQTPALRGGGHGRWAMGSLKDSIDLMGFIGIYWQIYMGFIGRFIIWDLYGT